MTTTSIAAIAVPSLLRAAVKARIIGALLLGSALAGCGFLQLTYNNAPKLVQHWLDGYVDFGEAQAPRVRADLEQLQRWHRAHELPRYAALLERLIPLAPTELGADTVCGVQREVQAHFAALLNEAEPAITRIALEFSPAQLLHLERKFTKQNAQYRKKWIDAAPDRQFQARLDRALDQAQRIYGHLEEPQLMVLHEQLARSAFDPAQTLAETQRRQRDTLATLQQLMAAQGSQPPEQARVSVHGWLERTQRSPDLGLHAHRENIRQQACANIAGLHNSTTPAQRNHAAATLRGYLRDLRELGRAH